MPSAYEIFPGMLPEPSKFGILLIKKCMLWWEKNERKEMRL
jgi:hypothetical protein